MQKAVHHLQNISSLRVLQRQSLNHMGSKRSQIATGQHSSPIVHPVKRGKIKSSKKKEIDTINDDPEKAKVSEHRIDVGDEHSDLLGYDVFSGKLSLLKKTKSTSTDEQSGSTISNQDSTNAKLSSKALVWGSQTLYLEDFVSSRRSRSVLQWVSGLADQQCFIECLPHPMVSSKKHSSELLASIPLFDQLPIKCKRPPRVLVILNPRSGHGGSSKVFHGKVESIFELAGFKMEVVKTTAAGHARKLASTVDFSTCPDGIICVGGDGIVNEVLNGLLSRDKQKEAISVPIGVIPAGSDNSLAWTILGVRDPISAAMTIVKGGLTATDVFAVEWIQTGIIHYGTTVSYFGFLCDGEICEA